MTYKSINIHLLGKSYKVQVEERYHSKFLEAIDHIHEQIEHFKNEFPHLKNIDYLSIFIIWQAGENIKKDAEKSFSENIFSKEQLETWIASIRKTLNNDNSKEN